MTQGKKKKILGFGFCSLVSTNIIVLLILLATPMGFCFPFSFFGIELLIRNSYMASKTRIYKNVDTYSLFIRQILVRLTTGLIIQSFIGEAVLSKFT